MLSSAFLGSHAAFEEEPLKSKYICGRAIGDAHSHSHGDSRLAFAVGSNAPFVVRIIRRSAVDNTRALDTLIGAAAPTALVAPAEVCVTENYVTVVFPFAGGKTVEERCNKKRLMEDDAKVVFVQIVQAVAYLHSKGLAHGELWPNNVVFASSESPVHVVLSNAATVELLTNSDLARALSSSMSHVAPEVLAEVRHGGSVAAAKRSSDIWNLGVLLHVLLSGVYPFHSAEDITHGRVLFEHSRWKTVSLEAKTLVQKILTPSVDSRPDIQAILANAWLAGVTVPAWPASGIDKSVVEPPAKERVEIPAEPVVPEVVAVEPVTKKSKREEAPAPAPAPAAVEKKVAAESSASSKADSPSGKGKGKAKGKSGGAAAAKKRGRSGDDNDDNDDDKANGAKEDGGDEEAKPPAAKKEKEKMTLTQLKKLRVDELRGMLTELKLDTSGLKADLVQRVYDNQ